MKWYLIDCCGEISEDITAIPKKYQTKKAAIEYAKNIFKGLASWQKNLRTDFYIAFGYYNKSNYDFNFTEYVDCMEGLNVNN